MPRSFKDVIDAWTSLEAMASDVGAKPSAVSKWRQRENIPPEWWGAILKTSVAKEKGFTAGTLINLAARDRRPALAEARA